MTEDLSLKSFTAVDRSGDPGLYMRALEAFDSIPQLQELKEIERGLVRPSSGVLDVGCGFGLETLRLARLAGSGGRVAGVDKSADFIAEARRRAAADGLAIDFGVGDAAALACEDAAFDHVRAERLLIYLDDPARTAAEMRRVARPGGSLAFIEPDLGTTTVNLPDRAAVRRAIAHEADTAVAHSWLPGRLAGMLDDLGLKDVAVATRVLIFPPDLAAEYFGSVGRGAHADGALSDRELDDWLAGIADLRRRGRLFGTVGYFLFTARA